MKRIIVLSIIGLIISVIFYTNNTLSYTTGGPPANTGAPGENTCALGCHSNYPLNSGSATTSISGINQYTPSQNYTITVGLNPLLSANAVLNVFNG